MFVGFAWFLACLLAGELTARSLHLPLPGSVVGLVFMVLALRLRLVAPSALAPAARLLTRRMGLFFVPAGVAVMLHEAAIRSFWVPILIASVVSFVVVLTSVGLLASRVGR